MKTTTVTYYFVALAEEQGSHFSPDGYSKGGTNYGYKEALAHIEELKESVYEGKKHYADKKFKIIIETRVVSEIPLG